MTTEFLIIHSCDQVANVLQKSFVYVGRLKKSIANIY